MSRILGPDHKVIGDAGEELTDVLLSAVWHTLDATASKLQGAVTLDSLSGISTTWQQYVPALRQAVGQSFLDAAALTRGAQRDAVVNVLKDRKPNALLAAAGDPFEVPLVSNDAAAGLMGEAQNRLSNVGNEIWELARSQLVEGIQGGEQLSTIRDRVVSVTDFISPRANVIARSEVAYAMNLGSFTQMQQLDVPGMTKEWLAVRDFRTRVEHADLDGVKVPLDTPFPDGRVPGAEPNCRCTYGYDISDEGLEDVCGCG